MITLRASYSGSRGSWRATLRDGLGNVVWVCEHVHRNRDHNRIQFGQVAYFSARRCAEQELDRRLAS